MFCSVLNARLAEAMKGGILGEVLGGFRRNHGAVDQVFVVNGIGQLRKSGAKRHGWHSWISKRHSQVCGGKVLEKCKLMG